jgi:two-component system NtrC family sensor kinase
MNTSPASRNRHILLIDDMPAIHDDFRKILAPRPAADRLRNMEAAVFGNAPAPAASPGFELDSAYQGEQGVALVEAAVDAGRPYALAFVDMLMPPGLDGVETIERLWRIDPHVQVVICTAYSDHPWEKVLRRLDAQDRLLVIKKPCDMIEVSQLAWTLTAKWTVSREAESRIGILEQSVQELQATQADLRRSNEALEAFVDSTSRQLRSSLVAMSRFSSLLAHELEGHPNVDALRYLSRIEAGATAGERLIEALLGLARIARAELDMEQVDLTGMAGELLAELRRADPQRLASFTVHDGLRVLGDRRLIQLAMRQLLANAWKFTSHRGHAAIEVGGYEGAGKESVFFVRDNGEGFDMAHAGKLFGTFPPMPSSKEFAGTGLGLAAAARIIDRHGGHIWADSKPGEGATFYFTLRSASAHRGLAA